MNIVIPLPIALLIVGVVAGILIQDALSYDPNHYKGSRSRVTDGMKLKKALKSLKKNISELRKKLNVELPRFAVRGV